MNNTIGYDAAYQQGIRDGWLAQPPLSCIRPDRKETSLLGAHVPKSVHRLIRLLAVEESTTVSALLCEAVALIIEKYGRATPPELEHDLANRKDGRRCKRGHADAVGASERFESGEFDAPDFLGHAARSEAEAVTPKSLERLFIQRT